jgi:hypothetical protein
MASQVVTDADLLARAATPERPQVPAGSWNCWRVLRDAGAPAAVTRGEYDDRLAELYTLARAHGSPALVAACKARLDGAPTREG